MRDQEKTYDDLIDLGAASAETKGGSIDPQLDQQGQFGGVGLTDE